MFGTVDRFDMGGLQPAMQPQEAVPVAARVAPSLSNLQAGTPFGESTVTQNHIHTLAANGATAGTFTLTFRGYTTTVLNYNDTAATVAAALNALASIANNGTVTGGGTAVNGAGATFTWSGGYASQPIEVPTLNIVSAFATTQPTLTSTTVGSVIGTFVPYVTGGANGAGTFKALSQYRMSTDSAGLVTFGDNPTAGEQFGQKRLTAPFFVKGYFRLEDILLTGTNALDATGVAQAGRVIRGSVASGHGIIRLT